MYRPTATRPIRLDSYVRSQARLVWANLEKFGKVGVEPCFLQWLNDRLRERGKYAIMLKKCQGCGDAYWTEDLNGEPFVCDDCAK